jgi:hypothetical protein
VPLESHFGKAPGELVTVHVNEQCGGRVCGQRASSNDAAGIDARHMAMTPTDIRFHDSDCADKLLAGLLSRCTVNHERKILRGY